MKKIPNLLGLSQGDWILTQGLAKGKMQFSQLSPSLLRMEQEILLNNFARKAIEQLIEGKLSSSSNNVKFRFEVKEVSAGKFEYSLYDKGNNKLLVKGPVTIKQGKSTSTYQEVEFKATLAKMTVQFRPEGKRLNGVARFHVGPIPVPGKLTFVKGA